MKPTRTLSFLSLALTLTACAGTTAAPEMTARDVIARHVHATRADEMIANTSSSHLFGTIELAAMGLKGDMEIQAAKPARFLMRQTLGPAGTTLIGYDGSVGWMSSPMMGGTSLLDGAELFALGMQADYFAGLMEAKNYDVMELEGREEFDGKDCWRVRLVYRAPEDPELAEATLKSRTSVNWFDAETGLQAGMNTTQTSPQGEMEITVTFDEYADIDGYLFPVRSTQEVMSMQVTTTIDEVEVNTVDDSVFELPDDVKALLGA